MSEISMRRAIVGTLLRAGRPMSITELNAAVLVSRSAADTAQLLTPKLISDVLRYQIRLGRVRRVRRGVYEAIPAAWSRSTAWRYVNWETTWDQRHRRNEDRAGHQP
jgi:hypothetical protein